MKLNKTQRDLSRAFKEAGLSPSFGDSWLNIARPDGVHCEFYPCIGSDPSYEIYTATYTVDGRQRELDFDVPMQTDEFIKTVCKILDHRPKNKKTA